MEAACVLGAPAIALPAFARPAPLALDLGCGNGVFLAALAAREPARNFLGVERKEYRVRQARRRASSLPNARVSHAEVDEVLRGVASGSVEAIYLLFSDPWPKRRHSLRRVVRPAFIELAARALSEGGTFYFASDSSDYCASAKASFASAGWGVGAWEVPGDYPRTEFEQRFLDEGIAPSRFLARKEAR